MCVCTPLVSCACLNIWQLSTMAPSPQHCHLHSNVGLTHHAGPCRVMSDLYEASCTWHAAVGVHNHDAVRSSQCNNTECFCAQSEQKQWSGWLTAHCSCFMLLRGIKSMLKCCARSPESIAVQRTCGARSLRHHRHRRNFCIS